MSYAVITDRLPLEVAYILNVDQVRLVFTITTAKNLVSRGKLAPGARRDFLSDEFKLIACVAEVIVYFG